jgi:hypothetical protein
MAVNVSDDFGAYVRTMQALIPCSADKQTICVAFAIVAGSPAIAQAGRYELVREPNAIFYRDTNIGGDNVRIQYQFVLYVSFDVQVRSHCTISTLQNGRCADPSCPRSVSAKLYAARG